MIIKELDASFGKLSHQKLSLKDGLNIIYAPNESGKSTWSAFIRAMLYGINTSQRDKIGFLSDKTKYRPWNGAAMEGTMVVTSNGRDISIQRTAQGSAPMRRLKATYVDNGERITDISGETLTGATEEIFSRTAFIGQNGVKVDQNTDLERRISSLVSSGSEDISYSQTDSRLRAWQRKLRYNKSGKLPGLEQELANVRKQLSDLERASNSLAKMKLELNELEAHEAQLKSDLEVHRKLEERETKQRLLDARKTAETSKSKADKLRKSVNDEYRFITREQIAALRSDIAALEALKDMASDSLSAMEKAEKENQRARRLLSKCVIQDKSPDYVAEQTKKAEECEKAIRERSKNLSRLLKPGLAVLSILSAIASLAFMLALDNNQAAIVGFTVCAASAIGALCIPHPGKKARIARDSILSEFNMYSVAELSKAAGDYIELSTLVNDSEINVNAAETSLRSAAVKSDQAENELMSKAHALFPQADSTDELSNILTKAEETLNKLTEAEFDLVYSNNMYNVLLENYDGDPDVFDDEFLAKPIATFEDTQKQLNKASASLSDLRERYNLALGAVRTMGDPVILNGEVQEIVRQIDQLNARYDALTLAIQTLKDADSELQTRFSPVISRIAGEYMNRLTDGRYEKVLFDKKFDATAKAKEDSVSRSILSLSRGTADQLYLSLRLAMCEMMLSEPEPCPIILDDALVNFDDYRMASSLNLLLELSEKRQIILFSCHNREVDYFKGSKKVNIVRTKGM